MPILEGLIVMVATVAYRVSLMEIYINGRDNFMSIIIVMMGI